ncbi:MAG: cupin domain-containing protein [Thermovibrio sp.]|nr:MAG: cupin domain-containing protein [Thermovibrio sp.]
MVERTGITEKERIFEELQKEGYTNLYVWSDSPGTFYDWHTHPFDEVRWVIEGEITIGTEGGTLHLKPGDKLRVPAGTRHWAKVGKAGVSYVCGTKLG